jgi:hypothetical protein
MVMLAPCFWLVLAVSSLKEWVELRLVEAVIVKEATAGLILAVALWAEKVVAKNMKKVSMAKARLSNSR